MRVLTARVDKKKIAVIAAIAAGLILAILLLSQGGGDAVQTGAPTVADNSGRVAFLKAKGWDVVQEPSRSGQVRIPEDQNQVFQRYNALQKSQGYDLSQYAGKTVMRYVYTVNNYPNATEPVYATLLVYNDQIIGGDITDTAAKGQIRGLEKPAEQTSPTQESAA